MSDGLMMFGSVPSDSEMTRVGLVVSKRVGGAVTRNRVKRRLRECFSSLAIQPGYDIVVSARPAAAHAEYHMLLSSLKRLAGRARVLQHDPADPAENTPESAVNTSAHEGITD